MVSEGDVWVERQLWGGAATASLPARMVDISDFRPVPDHQEVFSDGGRDQSVVFEIVEHDASVPDDGAGKHFLDDLALCNAASHAEALRSMELGAEAMPGVSRAAACRYAHGRQCVAKGRDDPCSASNQVDVQLVVVRLPHAGSDVVLTVNTPLVISPASSSAVHAGAGVKGMASSDDELRELCMRILRSLTVHDWGLFGA